MNTFIHNKDGEKLAVVVEGLENKSNHKLVFIEHGLSSYKEYYVVRRAAEAFLANGYVVVTFDTRFSFGESDGDIALTSLTNSIADLETIIEWAKTQDFYTEPFALCGHSLGGGSILYYAENNPSQVNRLVPLGAMVGGKYYLRSYMLYNQVFFEKWRDTNRRFCRKSNDKSISGYVPFDFVLDLQNYDLVFDAVKITADTLLITGEEDKSSTVYNNERLFEKITSAKELVILKGCPHTFDSESNQKELYETIDKWLKGYAAI